MPYIPGAGPSNTFQTRFLKFHEAIKLKNTDENATLREKRDAVLKRMRDRDLSFEFFNQGSYAMGTGCKPIDDDFDIDVGIVFSGPRDCRPIDPLTLKAKVRDAVDGHTSTPAKWMRHCVRVQYTAYGEPKYHVDLAVYWQDIEQVYWESQPRKGDIHLAVGKEHSQAANKEWQPAEPIKLRDLITNYGSVGEARNQFKRVIRYLKRWRQEQFPSTGNAAPIGIGISVAALAWFRSDATYSSTEATVNDLAVLSALVEQLHLRFGYVYHDGQMASRLVVNLPAKPGLDVFRKMSNQQMIEFKQRLDTLATALVNAQRTGDARYLSPQFGSDFPVL